MYIDTTQGRYCIKRRRSIYVRRSREQRGDIDVMHETEDFHGMLEADGRHYETVLKVEQETGKILRQYAPLPPEIAPEALKDWGYLETIPHWAGGLG